MDAISGCMWAGMGEIFSYWAPATSGGWGEGVFSSDSAELNKTGAWTSVWEENRAKMVSYTPDL